MGQKTGMNSSQRTGSSSVGHTLASNMLICSAIDSSESRYSFQLSTVWTQFPHSEEVWGLNIKGQR